MLISYSDKPLVAISFDTATFKDLQYWLHNFHGKTLSRIEPSNDQILLSPTNQYINLIIKDLELRQLVTQTLDQGNHDRFSYIHPSAVIDSKIDPLGIVVGPATIIYPNVTLNKDIYVHGNSLIAHFCNIGTGTYISGSVTIGGSVNLGEFCWIGLSATIHDSINVASHTVVGSQALVRKHIESSGTYIHAHVVQKKIK